MNPDRSAFAYRQSAAFGASAIGQGIALYDTMVQDFRRAMAAMEAGEIEIRVNALNHTPTITGELQGVLDFERGGEAAHNLSDFYTAARAMTIRVNRPGSGEKLHDLIAVFMRILAVRSKAEHTVCPSELTARVRSSAEVHSGLTQNAAVALEESSGSSSGRWSAAWAMICRQR